jgi:hypothetical protein
MKAHRCRVPECGNWTAAMRWCCHQHEAILGWRAAAGMQTAWLTRIERPDQYHKLKAETLALLQKPRAPAPPPSDSNPR